MANKIIFGPWSGGVTADSAVVKLAVENDHSVRLSLTRSNDPGATTTLEPNVISVSEMTVFSFDLKGLQPDAVYEYAPEIDNVIAAENRGRFRTFPKPDSASSFMFVCAGDANTGSNDDVFDRLRQEALTLDGGETLRPLFFLHLGDLHYQDVNSTLTKKYRDAYSEVLESERQSQLYRDLPLAYIWDDHDSIANNSHRLTPGRKQARLTYQECFPHYPLVAGAGDVPIYQAFTVGRVRFLLTDTRSERDPQDNDGLGKTMLGEPQKKWLKRELLEGKQRHPLVVWVSSVPWIGKAEEHKDEWCGYPEERAELAEFIAENGIRNICMLSADAHMLAIDDGSNNKAPNGGGGFPIFHASPLDKWPRSVKGGPYKLGPFKNNGQYGVCVVRDNGGAQVQVEWIGKRASSNEPLATFPFKSPRD